ncbi:MAG TPA: ABC transporter ATP-binding protein [Acidobacteriota bacterium]|nr:ABC transporter ATP-binding protein [Acidobacteriota bacterium]
MPQDESPAMIEARGLSKYYGPFVAVKDITFSIPKGQVVAFLGPNGAGKTTVMKILSGFLSPSEGTAFIAGLDVQRQRLQAATRLGYLPEDGPLYDTMTPLESLRFFGQARGLSEQQLQRSVDQVVEQCALHEVLEKPIGKISRGYRQRVGLAQALLHEPNVLIMDEPTAGLDPNQIRDFRSNVTRLGKSTTILISTHILQEVEAVAERVLFIHNGRLVYDGSTSQMTSDRSLDETFYQLTDYGRPATKTDAGGQV